MSRPATTRRGLPGFADGARLLASGLRAISTRGRLLGLGIVPPLITSVLYVSLIVVIVWQSPVIAAWLTPFAEGWLAAETLRLVVAGGIVLGSGLLLVLLFSSLTLSVGAPLYDRISESVDRDAGSYAREPDPPILAAIAGAVGNAVRVAGLTIPVSAALLLVGAIPVVGGVAAIVGSTLFGGWMVAFELIGSAAERRGRRSLTARHRLLRRTPWLSLGFGVPAFWLMSIPIVAVGFFPVAVAGGTLLCRRLDDHPDVLSPRHRGRPRTPSRRYARLPQYAQPTAAPESWHDLAEPPGS